MSSPEESRRVCEHCGAPLPAGADTCPVCPGGPDPAVPTGESPFAQTKSHAPVQFSLASMMLWVTIVAVILGAFSVVPGLGVGLAILAAPAFIRTAILAARRRSAGRPMDVSTKVWVFTGSLGLLTVIIAAVVGAFVATCFPLGLAGFDLRSGFLMVFAWFAGISVGIVVLYVLFRLFRHLWPRGE